MQQATNNVFTPSAFVMSWDDRRLGFVVYNHHPRFNHINIHVGNYFLEKHLESCSRRIIYLTNSIVQMKSLEKSEPKNNRSKPRLPFRKSTWAIIMLFVTIIALSGAVLFSPGCSPVSLILKMWGIEFQLEKGECSLPQLPSQ